MKARARLTLFDVVKTVQDAAASDEEVVAVVAHLFKSGRLVRASALGDPAVAESVHLNS